ncbi:MAG: hypothetical protein HC794_06010 [Nitrospiraceae bacterium]|nr:hypothetical protein [Nitrospiraceae bacterium]
MIYYGLAKPGANTMIEGGPLYSAARQVAFAVLDPKQANALLDVGRHRS